MTDMLTAGAPSRAAALLQAAHQLLPYFEQGKALDKT